MTIALSVFAWLWLLIAAHEAGHFCVAYILDRPISRLVIGSGPRLREWYWRGIRCDCRLLPFSGEVGMVALSRRRWVNVAIFAAGPAVNVVLWGLLDALGLRDAANCSLILAAGNLVPVGNLDGAQIWRELRRPRARMEEI